LRLAMSHPIRGTGAPQATGSDIADPIEKNSSEEWEDCIEVSDNDDDAAHSGRCPTNVELQASPKRRAPNDSPDRRRPHETTILPARWHARNMQELQRATMQEAACHGPHGGCKRRERSPSVEILHLEDAAEEEEDKLIEVLTDEALLRQLFPELVAGPKPKPLVDTAKTRFVLRLNLGGRADRPQSFRGPCEPESPPAQQACHGKMLKPVPKSKATSKVQPVLKQTAAGRAGAEAATPKAAPLRVRLRLRVGGFAAAALKTRSSSPAPKRRPGTVRAAEPKRRPGTGSTPETAAAAWKTRSSSPVPKRRPGSGSSGQSCSSEENALKRCRTGSSAETAPKPSRPSVAPKPSMAPTLSTEEKAPKRGRIGSTVKTWESSSGARRAAADCHGEGARVGGHRGAKAGEGHRGARAGGDGPRAWGRGSAATRAGESRCGGRRSPSWSSRGSRSRTPSSTPSPAPKRPQATKPAPASRRRRCVCFETCGRMAAAATAGSKASKWCCGCCKKWFRHANQCERSNWPLRHGYGCTQGPLTRKGNMP
jgi:hypothetical protein